MELKTEQLLGTLEVLLEKEFRFRLPCHEDGATLKSYFWDATTQGTFTPLHVIQSEGWITQTDPEVAVTNWQWSEYSGLAAKGTFPPYNRDEQNILLDDATKLERTEKYQALLELLASNLENLQAFIFSCGPGYSLSIVVGQITEQKWICLSPTVPQETYGYVNNESKDSVEEILSAVEVQIQAALNELSKIQVYGWYGGGYENVHDYQMVYAVGNSRDQAIEQALAVAGLVEIGIFEGFALRQLNSGYSNEVTKEFEERSQHLNKFLSQTFPDLKLYRFCFWDYENLYILGQSATEDRVGIVIRSQFTYNP